MKPVEVTFAVRGRSIFPFDMLRYDQCWPRTSGDVEALLHMEDRVVYLMTRSASAPTVDRWRSFGWPVVTD